jgi:galactose mutarotase-like enzyme
VITLTSGALTAQINPQGAELSSLQDADGRELMTDADPAFWTGRAPLLFPIVGRLAGDKLRIDGQSYPMKQHGFARRMPWQVIEVGDASATFRLVDTEETRAAYPFRFRLDVTYRLTDATLAIEVTIANPGDTPLPASFGFHPAFAWPLPGGAAKEAHRIVFATDEPAPLRAIEGGLLAGDRASPLDGRSLPLSDALFADDALVWTGVRSQSVRYGADTGPSLEIAFPNTPDLGIWSKPVPPGTPGARFVCVEPWHGHADPAGFTGEFRDKPGVFEVAPGGEKRLSMNVTLHP